MIRNRIIDIENHKLYLNNPCNLIDKFMESRTIDETIKCIVYKDIDNYDEFGCRYFMLDPHYVALLDIIYMQVRRLLFLLCTKYIIFIIYC